MQAKTNAQIEQAVRDWLRSHHGVISRYEALRLGMSTEQIRSRLDSGEWVLMHRGVYRHAAVAHTPFQDLRAACVATRGVGVISHSSAAWVWNLLPAAPPRPDLSVPVGAARRIQGLTIHRSADLDITQAVWWREVLVTNPLRTLVDLAGTVAPDALSHAVDAAQASRLVTTKAVVAELERLAGRGRPGVAKLRHHLLDRGFIGEPAPSVLEARMQRLILTTRLPLPSVEVKIGEDGEYRLDIAWPAVLLAIEVDGYLWHFSPEHQRRDHNRRNRIQDAGWTLRVYTWRDVSNEPARVAREIANAYTKLAGS